MTPTTSITRAGEVVTVALTGEADYSVVTAMLDAFEQARAVPGVRRISVDLAEVRFMDSSALGALINGFRFARQDGIDFVVINPRPNVESLLTVTGVRHLLTDAGTDAG